MNSHTLYMDIGLFLWNKICRLKYTVGQYKTALNALFCIIRCTQWRNWGGATLGAALEGGADLITTHESKFPLHSYDNLG